MRAGEFTARILTRGRSGPNLDKSMGWPRSAAFRILVLAIATASLGAGCTGPQVTSLLEVRRLSPTVVERGRTASVSGGGFRAGSDARIRFVGTLHKPGGVTTPVDLEASARAVSADRVDVQDTERFVADLGGYGTFRGDLTVTLLSKAGEPVLTGVGRGLAFSVNDGVFVETHSELTRAAEAWAKSVGVAAEESGTEPGGLVITDVVDGPASAAGLRKGDVIVTANGVHVQSLEDLAPGDGRGEASLDVRRGGGGGLRRIAVSAAGTAHAPLAFFGESRLPLGILVISILGLLLLLSPGLSAVGAGLVAPWARSRFTRAEGVSPWRALRAGLVTGALLSVAVLGVVTVAVLRKAAPHLGLGWILALAFHPSIVTLLRPASGDAQPKIRSMMNAVTSTLPLLASLLVVWLWRGSLHAGAIMDASGTMPWTWPLWQHPALLVLCPFALCEGARALRDGEGRVPALYRWIHTFALATFMAMVFLGGFHTAAGSVMGSAVLFVGKALSVAVLLRVVPPMPRELRILTVAVCLTVSLVSYVALMRGHDPSPALGMPLFMLTLLAMAVHGAKHWRRESPRAQPGPALLL